MKQINVYDLNGNKMGYINALDHKDARNILKLYGLDWRPAPQYL